MCKISRKNSKWLLRKWQTTLGDTFFAAHCIYPYSVKVGAAKLLLGLVPHLIQVPNSQPDLQAGFKLLELLVMHLGFAQEYQPEKTEPLT